VTDFYNYSQDVLMSIVGLLPLDFYNYSQDVLKSIVGLLPLDFYNYPPTKQIPVSHSQTYLISNNVISLSFS
jgi:hypothetical protein